MNIFSNNTTPHCRKGFYEFRSRIPAILVLLLVPALARAEIVITLKNSFIEQFKNRATITATYTVDKAHPRPNPVSKDADIHIAGRAPEIELPTVAEIMNAASQTGALSLIRRVAGTSNTINITGAWRLWCEHGGEDEQIQGAALSPFDTTNPPHVFEIHPITKINNISTASSLHPIGAAFKTKDAEQAFTSYENKKFEITPHGDTTTLTTTMGGFNYVEFKIELNDEPKQISDGYFAMATVETLGGDVLVNNRRMVFVKGTPPETRIKSMHKGGTLHVLGIPRFDLAIVSFRINHAQDRPGILSWGLPYEMIIAGVYPH
jgi:hypothetical protein